MTPRRLIRWKSFWFGILVLGFLGWAWLATSLKSLGVRSGDSKELIGFTSSSGYVKLYRFTGVPAEPGLVITGSRHSSPSNSELFFGPPLRIEKLVSPDGYSTSEASIAYWLLVQLFFVPWAVLLAWRWRRQRILTKANSLS